MTNFEFYKDYIVDKNNFEFGYVDGKLVSCMGSCGMCMFAVGGFGCDSNRIKWLYEEYIEKPKLTKKERLFCELMETGWIARDADGSIAYYELHPTRLLSVWNIERIYTNFLISDSHNLDSYKAFSFVKWEDEGLWSIDDLLKLEVEE